MSLLAVDLGLRTGLALYNEHGKLVWYRSQHFATPGKLRRGARGLLVKLPEVTVLALEGGGALATIWTAEGEKQGLTVLTMQANEWRKDLLLPREQTSGERAKHYADQAARRVITWSETAKPTSLRHDAAEAILVGLWAVLRLGWLPALPQDLKA